MSTQSNTPAVTTNSLFSQKSVKERFEELLGERAPGFITSVLQVVRSNSMLANAKPETVLNAAATAAALGLPLNNSLGVAWIVPYKGRNGVEAQFQIGWRGLVQLALRTGKYKKINAVPVYENQFNGFNSLTEDLNADFNKPGEGEIVGYAAYLRLIDGFEKTSYWTREQVEKHAKRYSQSFKSKHSPWSDPEQFHAMAMKTVLKNTISKYGIISIEMENAITYDQSVQTQEGFYYPDNAQPSLEEANQEKENNRILEFINKATTVEELQGIEAFVTDDIREDYNAKMTEINA